MIVRENKEFEPLCNISIGETFKYRDTFYMVVCHKDNPESGYIFCVDLETGWICQIKLSTHVEKVDCICNIRSYKNEE